MKIYRIEGALALGLLVAMALGRPGMAQDVDPALAARLAEFKPAPLPPVEAPARDFKTAEEHYQYLLEQAKGGTKHTAATLPNWDGLWTPGPNTIAQTFLDVGTVLGHRHVAGRRGTVKKGVLTPPTKNISCERRAEVDKARPAAVRPAHPLRIPGHAALDLGAVRQGVRQHSPKQTWMMNDFMNETRRIYINGKHVNVDGKHSATGDSIGFWDKDKLIIWTKWINPADYTRGMPLTSNKFEMVETWQRGARARTARGSWSRRSRIYDPLSLVKPVSLVYSHDYRPDLEKIGVRIRNWECSTSSNSLSTGDGNTTVLLPGDPEYKDARGTTDFPDLPGQSLDPFNEPAP